MKIKKSKIVVPALGLLLLSTAASVSGSVAWFTANRTFNLAAGNFAVVNTKDNLECVLDGGIGTTDTDAHTITVTDGWRLTDASFDHTDAKIPVIEPDDEGTGVGGRWGLAAEAAEAGSALGNGSAGAANTAYFTKETEGAAGFLDDGSNSYDLAGVGTGFTADAADKYYPLTKLGTDLLSGAADLKRDASQNIYSAFTWTMTFKVSFSAGATKKVGLFLDLSNKDTWVHKVGGVNFASGHIITANEAATYYTNEALDTGEHAFAAGDEVSPAQAANTWYTERPTDTGKGFRLAFVPTTVSAGSYGVTKIWAENQTAANSKFIDGDDKYVLAQAATAYGTATTKNIGSGLVAETIADGYVLMDSACAEGIPATGNKSSSTALSSCHNYLGYFAPSAGNTVEMTYTVYAWYEGTDENIVNTSDTVYETVKTSMQFGVANLSD